MKKVLSILLVIAMAATLFAGCGTEPTPTPSETEPDATPSASATETTSPTTTEPTKDPKTSWTSSWKDGDALTEIIIYDDDNYLTRWGVGTKIKLAEYGLKMGTAIAPVLDDRISMGKGFGLVKTDDGRDAYLTELATMFTESENKPDVLPALYASNVGTGAAFKVKSIYKNLVNLAPFIEEGGALGNYVDFVWNNQFGNVEYWETAKEALMVDGALYVLPRVEMLPYKNFLMFNQDALTALNISTPKTLAELESALERWVAEGNAGFVFNPDDISIENILTPIANMYGLDFSVGFDWKEKNGEPIFSYYFPEYRNVLETASKWAKNGWVLESATKAGCLAMCEDLASDANISNREDARQLATSGLVLYGGTATGNYLTGKYDGSAVWTNTTVSAAGYDAAITGESAFDYVYFAIGNASVTAETEEGYATVLQIMAYFNDTLTEKAYIEYAQGWEGIPFAETFEQSGSWVYVTYDDGKQYCRTVNGDDRFSMNNKDDADLPMWQAGRKFYRTLHPLYTWLFDVCNSFKSGDGVWRSAWGFDKDANKDEIIYSSTDNNYDEIFDITQDSWITPGQSTVEEVPADMSEWEYFAKKASLPESEGGYGITEFMYDYNENQKLWMPRTGYQRWGTDWHADITGFPMRYTIYFMNESQSRNYPNKDIVVAATGVDGTNSQIMAGFFPAPTEVLSGAEASEMNLKIKQLSSVAKQFTIDYLSGKKGNNDWDAYIKNLEEIGIKEVYDFYNDYAYTFNTQNKDGVKSMSSVLK